MALKIRLRQQGKTNHLIYRLVVVDSRAPRDGKYLEMVGNYNPHLKDNQDITVIEDRIQYWIDQGAQMTEKAHSLIARSAPGVIKSIKEAKERKLKKRSEKRKKEKAKK